MNPCQQGEQQISDKVGKLQWCIVTYADLAATFPNLMQISFGTNPKSEPYRKGNLGK